MPSFAQNLERTLHNALANASERRHEYATLEHLLLALIDDEDAALLLLVTMIFSRHATLHNWLNRKKTLIFPSKNQI